MSKIKDTLRRFEESLDAEAIRIKEAIEGTKQDVRESVEGYLKFEDTKAIYREFYLAKLKEAGVESEDDMEDEDEKEKFKKDVEESWEGTALDDAVIEAIQAEAILTPKFVSDDPREYEEPAKGKSNVDDQGLVDADGNPIADPEVNAEAEKSNDDAAPEKEKVDDQTDVSQEQPKVNMGEPDSQEDPLA